MAEDERCIANEWSCKSTKINSVLNQLNGVLENQIIFLCVTVMLSKSLKLIFNKFYVCSRYL